MKIRLFIKSSHGNNYDSRAIRRNNKEDIYTPTNDAATSSFQKISITKNLLEHEIKEDPFHCHPNKCNSKKIMQHNSYE